VRYTRKSCGENEHFRIVFTKTQSLNSIADSKPVFSGRLPSTQKSFLLYIPILLIRTRMFVLYCTVHVYWVSSLFMAWSKDFQLIVKLVLSWKQRHDVERVEGGAGNHSHDFHAERIDFPLLLPPPPSPLTPQYNQGWDQLNCFARLTLPLPPKHISLAGFYGQIHI